MTVRESDMDSRESAARYLEQIQELEAKLFPPGISRHACLGRHLPRLFNVRSIVAAPIKRTIRAWRAAVTGRRLAVITKKLDTGYPKPDLVSFNGRYHRAHIL